MKRVALFAAVFIGVLLLPLIFVGALLTVSNEAPSPSERALDEIPHDLIGLYQAAANSCDGLDWTILAAIHKVETGFGKGPATSLKGALGPMQFMPATFDAYGLDGDGDGDRQVEDVVDAVFSAANLLCANGAGDPARLAGAIWNYNHSQTYVNEVLTLASGYGVFELPQGIAYAATSDLLSNRRVILTPSARADLEAGTVDPRLMSLLSWIADRHTIGVTVFTTGHSKYTRSGSVSNHFYGRAADIFFVDGLPVGASNLSAQRVVLELSAIEGPLRASEVGHPFWMIGFAGGFTDADHDDHIHVGFDP